MWRYFQMKVQYSHSVSSMNHRQWSFIFFWVVKPWGKQSENWRHRTANIDKWSNRLVKSKEIWDKEWDTGVSDCGCQARVAFWPLKCCVLIASSGLSPGFSKEPWEGPILILISSTWTPRKVHTAVLKVHNWVMRIFYADWFVGQKKEAW